MTTISELIEKLKEFPPDTLVLCGKEKSRPYYTEIVYDDVDIEYMWVRDYTDETYKKDRCYGKRMIFLEAKD